MGAAADHFIGLMSGTSLDGVDGVLCRFEGDQPQVVAHVALPFTQGLKQTLLDLNTPGTNELHRAALAANALARTYVAVVARLLGEGGLPAWRVLAIGAHGQTVRHQPGLHDGTGYTLQLNNPALLAEHTGIDVVADFRSRDIAAGGQGAPLVPAFHARVFGQSEQTVSVLNLGGISNLTVIPPRPPAQTQRAGEVRGFDCGPGNALMDHWCQQHTGQAFDRGGAWAAQGEVHTGLLQALLNEPFLDQPPPKSTGRDLFNPDWLAQRLAAWPGLRAADVQATLTEFTALACANALKLHGQGSRQLLVCGGGALNDELMRRLRAQLPDLSVRSTAAAGLPPLQVEAVAFAWLARQAVLRQTGSLPSVTGAEGARILGALYPAGDPPIRL
ncbi:anhydro-N-acetylmuramic acid kinase [Curvibacter sp. HBC61]|uniref:Anhydro-N-acetylmuramic acid kinase n=1 Tax=Curvibacter cyanobacteriorum TaxID=3026422 RepID=A0ABT5N5N5_9BURK|nr:anhydro-N-acetylmuramic acid kinase [Curvibacter sp. HBC61]MDD0840971.1 anhydro-N-acetylmuramic acid kinase [Curvibacter sp. HBC61]